MALTVERVGPGELMRSLGQRYQVMAELGRGAMGAVYRAWDRLLEREVAIKVLTGEQAELDELKREFRVAASLRHPNVIRLFDLSASPGRACFFSMELLDAQPLSGEGGVAAVVPLAIQALSALDYLERHGLCHGDLKPDNLMVTTGPDPVVKLVDFGLSLGRGASGLTGTPAYMPPELARGASQSPSGDMYALGVVLYEALAGTNPFLAATPAGCIDRHTKLVAESLHRVVPGVELGLAGFVDRLLQKSPERRFANPKEALASLMAVAGGDEGALVRPALVEPPLVAREAAFEAIDQTLARAAAGEGGALVLVGPPGTGRTELCQALQVRAQLEGLRCGVVRLRPGRDDLAGLETALTMATDAEPPGAQTPEGLADFALSLCEEPLVLVVDDVDRASVPVAQALAALVQASESRPLVIVVAGSAAGSGALAAALKAAEVRGAAARVELGPLDEAGTLTLLESALGAAVDEGTLGRVIHSASLGSPAASLEVLRHLVRGGQLAWRQGRWTASQGLEFGAEGSPLEQLWTMRFDGLGRGERAVLVVLAALDHPARTALLARASGLSRAAVVASLNALHTGGMALPAGEGAWALSQPALVHVARARGGKLRWARAHREALAMLPAEGAAPERLARRAREAGDEAEARRLGGLAIEAACARGDLQAAAQERLALLPLLEGEAAATVRGALGRGLHRLGRFEEAVPHLEAALAEVSAGSADELALLSRLADGLARLARTEAAGAAATRLMEASPEGHPPALLAGAWLEAAKVLRVLGDNAAAKDRLETALALPLGEGDSALRAEILRELATLGWLAGSHEGAAAQAMEAIALCQALGDELGVAHGRMTLGTCRRVAGDFPAATALYDLAAEHYGSVGSLAPLGKARNNAGVSCYLSGDWARAAEHWEEAIRVAEMTGEIVEQTILGNNLGFMFLERGALARAEAAFLKALDNAAQAESKRLLIVVHGNLGEVRAWQGQGEGARELFGEAIRLARELEADNDVLENERRLAELALLEGQAEQALELAEPVLVRARELGLSAEVAHTLRIIGAARIERGELAEAEAVLDEAVELQGGEESIDLARTWLVQAELALRDEETEHALALAEQARATFERSQAAVHLDRARKVLTRIEAALKAERGRAAGGGPLGAAIIALSEEWEPDACADRVLATALELTGAGRGTVYLPPTHEHVGMRVSRGAGERAEADWDGHIDAFSRTVASQVVDAGRSVCLQNVDDDQSIASAASVLAMNLRSVMCVPVPLEGSVRGLLYMDSALHIETDLERALPTVEQLARLLGMALDRIRMRERVMAQSEVVRVVAHEMRTPIAAVMGFAELAQWKLKGVELPELVTTLIRVTASEGERMKRMVADIQQLGHAWSFELRDCASTPPSELVEHVVSVLGPPAESAQVQLDTALEKNLPTVMVDARRVQQVFINLITNAFRYAPEGSFVTVGAEREPFGGRVGESRMVRFSVQDRGPGLGAEDKLAIFQKFNRGSEPRGDGSGLGLNIAQSIVQAHGGTMSVESEPGHGCTFLFTLPVA